MGMINLGSVFKSITSGLGSIAKTALQAVVPKVTELLKGVIGDGFDALKGAAQKLVGGLPGPFGKIAQSLIGKGFDYLKNLTGDALTKEIQKLTGTTQPPAVPAGSPPGTPAITVPSTGTAAGTAARAQATAAATAAVNSAAPSLENGFKQQSVNTSGLSNEDAIAKMAGAMQEPTQPGSNATEGQMIQYQAALQKYARTMDMLSKIMQAKNDMQKGIISNFRV